MKIKLRRDFQGQDSWGAFVEEVGISEKGKLTYRRSTGGNCDYGEWQDWGSEKEALSFMLGPIKVSSILKTELIAALSQLPDLEELDMPHSGETNYGNY